MTQAARLFVLRHAESLWNAERRWQGHADPELSERGRQQALRAAGRLAGEVEAVVSSDLQRAAETAEIIAKALDLGPVGLDPQLREIDVGEWAGLTTPEIDERWPGALEAWRRGEGRPPGGEDRSAFRKRIVAALRSHASNAAGPLLVVCHGAAIGTIERHLGVHPGRSLRRLTGRWFAFNPELQVVGDRVSLLD